ncbi:GNAT family N-acetyltransferase [Nocardiopsis sp. L17-MgMaSL7]|uniref:GNAT family N-acetyltransferase n=1 Tax=Nocardiopsis sp. L17-MgMaSL7 TaxID=1938893 RepID=UPI000D7107B0|nr:GNAT family N-acetyltransferase [Nocardiopsis sp. L17-MgMaSL7]PWV57815.1 acetyltransferase (GNAT) family protein [Nocardiopsis sp. L17-MgMaSL7]
MLDVRPLRPGDARSLEALAQRLWPKSPHPGGLGWQLATEEFTSENAAVARRDGEVVGWAVVEGPDALRSLATVSAVGASDDPEAGAALLDWALARTGDAAVELLAFQGDTVLRDLAEKAGFALGKDNTFGEWMSRDATEEEIHLPDGYRIRAVREGEEEARVECHRTAWKPSDLPWPERVGTVNPDLTSRFSRERYDNTRAALLYDRELDLVVEAPGGSLAACCVVWWDPENRCSEIEPLGVVPAHRRRGLAVALALTACALTARRGGDRVYINTTPNEAYPTPAMTYATVGYTPLDRGTALLRPAR